MLDFRQPHQILHVQAIGVDVRHFGLELGRDSIIEWGLARFVLMHVVMASLAVHVEFIAHRICLDELQHALLLILILHPHHRVTCKITRGVDGLSPEDAALFVTAITGIETKTSEQTNSGSRTSKSIHVHGYCFSCSRNELVVVSESSGDASSGKQIREHQTLHRTAADSVDHMFDFSVRTLVTLPVVRREVELACRARTIISHQCLLAELENHVEGTLLTALSFRDIVFRSMRDW
mmetsp:Transcript_11978/g.19999  ORF Transcript_11978/g.19999 Transcript_11978/m.19999 type:complete len:236 (+) Transcript_11978:565-1272(+)